MRRINLTLFRNEDIYTQPVTVHRLRADGSIRSSETTPAGDHLAYRGTASTSGKEGHAQNWARVSLHVDNGVPLLEGASFVDGFEHHIQTDATYRRTRSEQDASRTAADQPYNVVWRYADDKGGVLAKRDDEATCGLGMEAASDLERRQRGGDTIDSLLRSLGSTSGCPSTRAIALLGIATDCSYTAQFSSEQDLRSNILTQEPKTLEQIFYWLLKIVARCCSIKPHYKFICFFIFFKIWNQFGIIPDCNQNKTRSERVKCTGMSDSFDSKMFFELSDNIKTRYSKWLIYKKKCIHYCGSS